MEPSTVIGSAGPAESPPERRVARRRGVVEMAMIVYRGGHRTMRCQILNRSENGALLAPADAMLCPKEFILTPDVGTPRHCWVVWRKNLRVGVRYA